MEKHDHNRINTYTTLCLYIMSSYAELESSYAEHHNAEVLTRRLNSVEQSAGSYVETVTTTTMLTHSNIEEASTAGYVVVATLAVIMIMVFIKNKI